ncbi:MAG: hypothetical protein ACLVJ6_06090 [Merdibacter sp.]
MKKKNYAASTLPSTSVRCLSSVFTHIRCMIFHRRPTRSSFRRSAGSRCHFLCGIRFLFTLSRPAGMRDVLTRVLKHYLRRLALRCLSVIYLPYTFLLWRGDGFIDVSASLDL